MRETELKSSARPFATATSPPAAATAKDSGKTEERRSSPRETLRHYVVLVFFGEDNWGKLMNMSETGMAIEFAKPPSLRDRVNFTFQAMGCMPMPRNGKGLGDSFEAPGEIVWTREFERGAGVHFVDLAEASREQIRQWLSFETSPETSPNTSNPAERAKPEVPPILAELLPPIEPGSDSEGVEGKKTALSELDMPVPFAEVEPEPDFSFLESSAAQKSYEAPRWNPPGQPAPEQAAPEQPAKAPLAPELPVTSHPSVARLTFLVVSGCLAAFAVTAAVRIYMTRAAHQADAEVRTSDAASAPSTNEPAAEVNVSSPDPASVPLPTSSVTSSASPAASSGASSAASAPPFQVGVLDANGRNWILWFVHGDSKNDSKNRDAQLSYKSGGPSDSSSPRMTSTRRQESAGEEKPQASHSFTMVAPTVSHPLNNSGAGQPSAEAPTIQPELTASSGNSFGGAIGGPMKPAAPAVHASIGGMVQQPRLIRTAPLVYPQLAKSTRLSGDVVVDALIDTKGNVTAVKVISGPVLLQQAAMDTVRQWKYEPARLDGQAVPMHLSVTVRFRLN